MIHIESCSGYVSPMYYGFHGLSLANHLQWDTYDFGEVHLLIHYGYDLSRLTLPSITNGYLS